MNTTGYQQALGRKIAAERRRRGLSRPELARMIGRSVAWASQVERGVRKVDRMSVLEPSHPCWPSVVAVLIRKQPPTGSPYTSSAG